MRIAVTVVFAVAALVAAAPAGAGCWATVGLAPPPEGIAPGAVWTAELTVRQHGRTPLSQASPSLTIVNATTGERRTFAAKVSDPAAGRYEARVVFPSAGSWRYRVFDGFTRIHGERVTCARIHTFAAVDIGGPGSGTAGGDSGGGSSPLLPLAGGLGGLLAATVLVGYLRRRNGARAPAAA